MPRPAIGGVLAFFSGCWRGSLPRDPPGGQLCLLVKAVASLSGHYTSMGRFTLRLHSGWTWTLTKVPGFYMNSSPKPSLSLMLIHYKHCLLKWKNNRKKRACSWASVWRDQLMWLEKRRKWGRTWKGRKKSSLFAGDRHDRTAEKSKETNPGN